TNQLYPLSLHDALPISAMVRSKEVRDMMREEPLLQEQFAILERANRILFGISSLRPNSTIHTSGFFESVSLQQYLAAGAVGVVRSEEHTSELQSRENLV